MILIENKGVISHFVVFESEKFAVARLVYDIAGGFADLKVGGIEKIIERFQTEVKEELGINFIPQFFNDNSSNIS